MYYTTFKFYDPIKKKMPLRKLCKINLTFKKRKIDNKYYKEKNRNDLKV